MAKVLSKRAQLNKSEFEAIQSYLKGLRARGERLPESIRRPGKPDLGAIHQGTKIRMESLLRPDNPCRAALDEDIASRGMSRYCAPKHRSFFGEVRLPLGEVLLRLDCQFAAAGKPRSFSLDRKAIDALIADLGKRSELGFEGHAVPLCRALIEERRATGESDAYAERMLVLAEQFLAAPWVGKDFSERLEIARGSVGLSRMELAHQLGVNSGTFNSWCSGAKLPDISMLGIVEALEAILEVDPGHLSAFVKPKQPSQGRVPASLFPVNVQHKLTTAYRAQILEGLPADFHDMTDDDKRAYLAARIEMLDADNSSRTAWRKLRTTSYACEVPAKFTREYSEYEAFKTKGFVPGRGFIAPERDWTGETPKIMRKKMMQFAQFLIGNGIKADPGLADTVNPSYIKTYVSFLLERQGKAGMRIRYTGSHRDIVTNAAAMVAEIKGYLRLAPGYEAEIKQILIDNPGLEGNLLSPEDVDKASFDSACDALHRRLKTLEQGFKMQVTNPKEHRERMRPLLVADNPLMLVMNAMEAHWDDVQNLDPDSRSHHLGVRNAAMFMLLLQTSIRRSTVCKLDHPDDGERHLLRGPDGSFAVKIGADLFKNRNSQRFEDDPYFRRALSDIGGAYAIIDQYLTRSRPALLGNDTSNALFVTSKGKRLHPGQVDAEVLKWSRRYLGISAGESRVGSFKQMTVHGFRDLIATSLLSRGNSIEEVANVLYDDPQQVKRSYARWIPKHHAARTEDVLARALEGGS